MQSDWWKLTAIELAARVRSREVSPVELVQASLARAERLQPTMNCMITLCADQAMADARRAEQALMRGEPTGLLHGLPLACKDIVDTQGVRTTFGSLLRADNVPSTDAVAMARLREQGAILIGKTTTSEFGAKCLTDAPLFGRTRNAWHPDRTSGGSSGGSAVTVACGIAPLAVATDGGGSTRIPAACNGVVGLKPSIGVVPHSQVEDAFGNLTYVTPMTRTVADTALMLQAMAGAHPCDPWSIGTASDDYLGALAQPATLRGLRVGYLIAPPEQPVARSVEQAFRHFLSMLEGSGASVHPMSPEGLETESVWRTINHTTWRARFGPMAERDGDRMTPSLLQQLALATDVSGIDYQRAMAARTRLFRHVQALLAQVDVLAMPTLMRTALPIDQDLFGEIEIDGRRYPEVRRHWFPWTMPFNLTGHPAVSLPCAFDDEGLPIGVQIVGPFRGDARLLQVCATLEAAIGLTDRWPDLE